MEATAEPLRKWAGELKERVPDSRAQKLFVWDVPAPFCAMQDFKDQRNLEGDWGKTEIRGIKARPKCAV